ncbi:unnamed protein product [Owenia fusiformis]|uniref:Uncharacterized protein n=1 Tax=Owenia fusiformis TaxID=6347 RepID=A0A8J1XSF4_OWEFU|nr:unnamed protein product [Owenia fusiformis]
MAFYMKLNFSGSERTMIMFLLIASCMLIRDCNCQPQRPRYFNRSYTASNDDSSSSEESIESNESDESDEGILYTDFGPLYILDNGTGPLPYPFNETKSVIPHSSKRTVGTMALVVLGGVFLLPILLGCYKFFKRLNTASEYCFKGGDGMETWVVDQNIERLSRRDSDTRHTSTLSPNEQLRCAPSTNDSQTMRGAERPSSNRTPFRVQFGGRHLSGPEYEMMTIVIRTHQDENYPLPIDSLPPSGVSPTATVPQPPSYEQATQPCSDMSVSQENTIAQSPPPYTKDSNIPSDDPINPPMDTGNNSNEEEPPPYVVSETLLPQSHITTS